LDFTNLDSTLFGKANVSTVAFYAKKGNHNDKLPVTHLTIRRTKATDEKLFFEVVVTFKAELFYKKIVLKILI
jgi:hypothetical protein